jgi:hypothetical protein
LWSFLFLAPQSPKLWTIFNLKQELEKELSRCWAAAKSTAKPAAYQAWIQSEQRQMDKIAIVYVELTLFISPESAVINNFHAKTEAWEGAEQLLTPLHVRHGFSQSRDRWIKLQSSL